MIRSSWLVSVILFTFWAALVSAQTEDSTGSSTRAMLMITGTVLPNGGGFKLTGLDKDGPCANLDKADSGGKVRGILEAGDVIIRIDGQSFSDVVEFQRLLDEGYRNNGGKVRLRVKDAQSDEVTDFIARPKLTRRKATAIAPEPKPEADKRSWVGKRVMAIRSGVQFGYTGADGQHVHVGTITEPSVVVLKQKEDWVRVRQGKRAGWCAREDLIASDRAVAYFDKRLRANSADVFAFAAKGAAYAEQKDYAKAREAFSKAARFQPQEVRWIERMAEMSEKEGDLAGATRAYARANEISPTRRVRQEVAARELKAEWTALAREERIYSSRLKALASREQAAATDSKEATTPVARRAAVDAREVIQDERSSLLRIRVGLDSKSEQLARNQARTGLAPPRTVADTEEGGTPRKASVLASLSGLQLAIEPSSPVRRMTDEITTEDLVGSWGYMQGDRYRQVFEIKSDRTAIASAYFANSGRGKAVVKGEQVEIVVHGTWGGFAGVPYLKWSLRYDDGKLVGNHSWREFARTGQGQPGNWAKPYTVKLQKRPEGK